MQLFSHWRNKRRKSLLGCILFSVLLHCVAVLLLQQYSLWFYSSSHSVRSQAGNFQEYSYALKDSDEVLKKTFQKLTAQPSSEIGERIATPMSEFSEDLSDLLGIEEPVFERTHVEEIPSMSHYLELFQNQNLIIGQVTQPGQTLNGGIHLWPHEEIYRSLREAMGQSEQLHSQAIVAADQFEMVLHQQEEVVDDLTFAKFSVPVTPLSHPETMSLLLTSLHDSAHNPQQMTLKEAQSSDSDEKEFQTTLPMLPSLSSLNTRSCSEGFDVDVIVTKQDDGDGYLFALTLIQNPSISFDTIPQNFTFLIDRSNTIQAKRLHSTCHAVIRALSYIPEGDSFNILAFDSKIDRLSVNQESIHTSSLKKAKRFLMNTQLASFFTSSDFQKPMKSLLFEDLNPLEAHSLIILSDGETLSTKLKDLMFIGYWTDRNRGFSVNSLVLEGDKNLPYLNLFCEMNQGKMLKAANKKGLKRKLVKLIQSISHPIATNVSCTAVSLAPHAKIKILPNGSRLSNLYSQQPFVIMGSTETLDDFVLFIQGKHKDQWLNIKKTISFKNAKKAGEGLKKQWALEQTYECFDEFTTDGNPLHLKQANTILETYNIESAFDISN